MHRQMTGAALAPIGSSENPSNRIFTLANIVTFCRLALTIAFLVTFVNHTGRSLALACYAIAATTDFLDGQIARRTQTVSWLGKVMDPVMDRLLLFTGVLGLIITGELPASSSRNTSAQARRFSKTSKRAGYALPLPLNKTTSSPQRTRKTFK